MVRVLLVCTHSKCYLLNRHAWQAGACPTLFGYNAAMAEPIYLDNHATTRVDPRVIDAMLPFLSEDYGNAGSTGHAFGEVARDAVERSQETIADAIGAQSSEIVFTSGATESNNLAIFGVCERKRRRGDHLISVQTEHHAVLDPLSRLAKRGYAVDLLPVAQQGDPAAGWLDPQQVADAIRDDTCLVSVMLANNEIGVIQPIAEIASICRERGVLLHCDATQGVGKVPIDVQQMGVDLMSFTAHKIYGSKGTGALYVRGQGPIVRLEPQIVGGGQQRGRRSGTLNVPGIIGLAEAVRICVESSDVETARLVQLGQQLWKNLQQAAAPISLCGPELDAKDRFGNRLRLPGSLMVTLGDVDGEAVMMGLGGVAISSGAACASVDPEPSHVLRALGLTADQARSSLRFGIGRFNTAEEIDCAAEQFGRVVQGLRAK